MAAHTETERSIKACVTPASCDKILSNEVFHAGYVQGQTRGFCCQLGLYFLLNCPRDPWDVPEIKAAVLSFTRLKTTFVIYATPLARSTDSLRVKARAEKVEETHPLMVASTLKAAVRDMGGDFVLNFQSLTKIVDDINTMAQKEMSNAKITSYKREACMVMVLYMDVMTFDCLFLHYRKYSWERSGMNSNMLRARHWGLGHLLDKPTVPLGKWEQVFTTSKESTLRQAKTLVDDWQSKFTVSAAHAVALPELQQSRLQVVDLLALALACAVFEHWLRPLVQKHFGDKGMEIAEEEWTNGQLKDDLGLIAAARGNAEIYTATTLATLPCLFCQSSLGAFPLGKVRGVPPHPSLGAFPLGKVRGAPPACTYCVAHAHTHTHTTHTHNPRQH